MGFISRGFRGRPKVEAEAGRIPPGQYVTRDFPVLSAGPTPDIPLDQWRFTISGQVDKALAWTWPELMALPAEDVTVDIHCVTKWTKLDTPWKGVSVDTLLKDVPTAAEFVMAHSYGGYTTNLPLEDVTGGKAWVAYAFDGEPLEPEHGGPARLLVPHLYFWKSAKWVSGLELRDEDEPGFWEGYGYNNYGDPWREQRYAGD
jgi:DMSO/TMAO reductase YedYZ molybdopterin-dependent catalytic subunit